MEQNSDLPSGLYIIATPIGNIGDMTLRALETLGKLDVLACEDTRVTGKLTTLYDIEVKKIPYHDHNADEMRPKILAMLREGKRVGLVSDAGMPLISDPGFKLVADCAAEGLPITCLPGASASLAALALSGLPTDRFYFAGFLPPKTTARRIALGEIKDVPGTLVFYETGPRLADSLADMAAVLGDRPCAVARELTKKFEEVIRGTLSALAATIGEPKGEIVVVVGAPLAEKAEVDIDALIRKAFKDGMSVKDASAYVATISGAAKKDVYARALELKK